ncbi:hypothetical protein C8J57DRAFT_1540518 [Mycena rebaudengoi]|nr:hypothetical protein C8J57DRAFT_1540518 [Mycena rebaudengoi]
MHTVELMPEPRAGFISGMLRMLECFHAIVDTPRAQRMFERLCSSTRRSLMCPDAPDGHVVYTAGARAAVRWEADTVQHPSPAIAPVVPSLSITYRFLSACEEDRPLDAPPLPRSARGVPRAGASQRDDTAYSAP